MRKSTLLKAVAVAVLPMLALSACGSTSDTNADAKGGEQTVTFWYSNSGPAVDAINQLVSEFNDAHKGKIKVEASYQGSYSDVQQKFSAAVQAKSTPSILQMNDTSTGYMIDSKMTTPVYKLAKGDSDFDTADLQPVALKYYSDDNGLLSLPFAISQPVTYINNKLAQEAGLDVSNPPTTFDEVVDWANTIHEKTGAYGFSMNMVDSWILEMLSASHGELIATPDNGRGGKDVTGVNMTSKTQLDMFQKIVDMFKDGTALNPGTDSSSMMTAFTSDKLGLVLTSSASYTSLLPGDSTSNVTVAQFPHDASNKKAGTPIGGNSLWIVAAEHSEAEQKATWEFRQVHDGPARPGRVRQGLRQPVRQHQGRRRDRRQGGPGRPERQGLLRAARGQPVHQRVPGCPHRRLPVHPQGRDGLLQRGRQRLQGPQDRHAGGPDPVR